MATLTNAAVLEKIQSKFGDEVFDISEPYNLLTISTNRETIISLLEFLYHDEALQVQFLTTLCGMHYPDQKDRELGVVYHMHSLQNNFRLRIKVFFPVEDPHIPTATNLYATANWMERETYDFYGVIFTGHPNLRRILNVDEMDFFPMRKEIPLEDQTREDKRDFMFGR